MEIQFNKKLANELFEGDFVLDLEPNKPFVQLFVVTEVNNQYLFISKLTNADGVFQRYNSEGANPFYVVSKQEALKFIAKQNPDGFTVNKNTLEPITEGWAVAVSETQNSFGEEGLKQVIEHAEQKSYIEAIGGWLNSKDGQYYFDAVMVVQDYETAAELGYRNKQKAVFNLSEGKEYELK